MAEIASWNGHSFTVSPKLIRGFTGLTIKGSSETEDQDQRRPEIRFPQKQQSLRNYADGGAERPDRL